MEYLVSFGHAGELGRFTAPASLVCQRGDRVVVRTPHGLEIGVVRCQATPRHARLLEGSTVGALLRLASVEDEKILCGIRERGQRLFEDARRLTAELQLPLEVLDVEIQFDSQRVTLYYLRAAECDERPLVRALSQKYEMLVALRDLAIPAGAGGCGLPNCGQGKGNCTACSSGGCASGCGTQALAKEVYEYFAGLRAKIEGQRRVPLA